MELFDALLAHHDRLGPLPGRWRDLPSLTRYTSIAELEDAIGRVNEESDAVIDRLLGLPADDPLVTPVLLAGLRPLLFLCRGRDRALLNELVTEVAIVIGEMRRVRSVTQRRLAYVIVDRARDRQRAGLRREFACRSIDPLTVAEALPDKRPGVDEIVAERLRLDVLRQQVAATGDAGLARSWNSLIELVDAPRLSQAERDRWKYIRRRLSGAFGPDAA